MELTRTEERTDELPAGFRWVCTGCGLFVRPAEVSLTTGTVFGSCWRCGDVAVEGRRRVQPCLEGTTVHERSWRHRGIGRGRLRRRRGMGA